jgi:glyoxylase-like metal-dependent hydrolase (beta-lactamase superfamily II)
MPSKLTIAVVESMPFAENSYIMGLADRDDAIVVDPGLEPDAIVDALATLKRKPAVLLNTHGHADHIAGNGALKQAYPAIPLIIGEGDAVMLTDANKNLSAGFGMPIVSPPADEMVRDGETRTWAGMTFRVHAIAGHSPGHVVFICDASRIVLGGDVLFAESIGRTDFPGGSFDQLMAGIHQHLFALPDDYVVYPGHGPEFTIGEAKTTNPFFA